MCIAALDEMGEAMITNIVRNSRGRIPVLSVLCDIFKSNLDCKRSILNNVSYLNRCNPVYLFSPISAASLMLAVGVQHTVDYVSSRLFSFPMPQKT